MDLHLPLLYDIQDGGPLIVLVLQQFIYLVFLWFNKCRILSNSQNTTGGLCVLQRPQKRHQNDFYATKIEESSHSQPQSL